jgi:hypothetical protein
MKSNEVYVLWILALSEQLAFGISLKNSDASKSLVGPYPNKNVPFAWSAVSIIYKIV